MREQLGGREKPGQIAQIAVSEDGLEMPSHDPSQLLPLCLVPEVKLIRAAL